MSRFYGVEANSLKAMVNGRKLLVAVHMNVAKATFVPVDIDQVVQMTPPGDTRYRYDLDDRGDVVYIDGIAVLENIKPRKSKQTEEYDS